MDHDGLTALLGQQSGVVARRQLWSLGCRPHDLELLIRRRALTRIHPGVFVQHTGPPSGQARAWAAVLALWPAALCAESALSVGPAQDDAPVHVAVARGRRVVPPKGVRVHLLRNLDERVLWNRSPPRLRYEDAVLDVASLARSELAAVGVLTDACRTRRTTPQRLVDTVEQRPRLRRRAWLRTVLADIAAGTTSVLEHGYLTAVERAHGLPRAARQVRAATSVGVVYRDAEYPDGLIVELDGRLVHDSAAQRDADLERDLDAALDGRPTLRLSWGQVFDRPCRTAAKLAVLLQQRGRTGVPHPCSTNCPVR